jgi:hypothetical protein
MRIVGNSQIALPQLMPSADALHQAAIHQATGVALMHVATSGVRKGVYRYAFHEASKESSKNNLNNLVQASGLCGSTR